MNEYSNTSVLDHAKSKIQLFKTLNNPSFDSQGMLHDLQHPGFMSTPDEYGFTDWVRDAWTDWNIMRNETNYSSELGKYQLDQVKVNELDNAEDYLRLVQYNTDSEDKVEIPEELGEEYYKLAKEYKLTGSIDDQISQIGKYKEELFASQNDALNEAKKYQDEAQDWRNKHDLSDYYEYKKEEGVFDQFNLDSYLYKLPGIFGSSSASLGLQALGLAAGLGASVAVSALTVGTATPWIAASWATGLSATALGANIASADRENKAEVFDNMKTRIIEQSLNDGSYKDVIEQTKGKLDDNSLTDDQVMDKILTNQVDVKNEAFNKSVHKALTGVEQLYASDMATVLGTESIETALTVIPFGALSKLGKLGKLGKAVNIASEKKSKLVDAITDRIDKVKYFGVDKSIKGMADRTKRGFILDLAGRQFVQASSEMIEESNQYLAAQEYIEGKYDGMQPSYIKGIADSWKHGARSLYSFYAPWDTALTSDKEWLENSRSGFVLGLLNVPNIVTTGVNARRAYKQVQGDKFVQDVAADDMFADKDRLNKNIIYAQHAINNREEEIYKAFDKAKEIGLEGIDAQMWDEERDHAIRIVNRANSKKIQQLAEERDIKKGTEDFNIYIGMIDYYEERAKNATEKYNELANEANKLLTNQQLFEDKFDAEYGISESEFESLSEEDKEVAVSNKAYVISRATTNARLSAYESILNDIEKLEQDAEEAHAKFGITYNKKDLNKAKSIIKKRYDTVLREDKDASSERDVELSSIQHDLINAYKHATWAEVDMLRANEDLAAVLTPKKKSEKAVENTKSRIAQYKKVQKQNQEFEQQLQDDHRNEEQLQEEVQPVEVDEEKIEQVENPTITQDNDIVFREVDEEKPIEKVKQQIEQPVEQQEETIEEKPAIQQESDKKKNKQNIRKNVAAKHLNRLKNATDVIDKINSLQQVKNVIAKDRTLYTDDEINEVYQIEQQLREMGYEIRELSGSSYTDGDEYIVDTFIPDDTLPVGARIVSGVRKPLILKDGVMVQSPSVTVRQNLPSESEDSEKLEEKPTKQSKSVEKNVKQQPKKFDIDDGQIVNKYGLTIPHSVVGARMRYTLEDGSVVEGFRDGRSVKYKNDNGIVAIHDGAGSYIDISADKIIKVEAYDPVTGEEKLFGEYSKKENEESGVEENTEQKLDLTDRIKELSQARQQIVETTTEVVSEYKAKKNRDEAMRRYATQKKLYDDGVIDTPPGTPDQNLEYYGQGVKHIYNRNNKYGKAHEDANDALVKTVEQVNPEISRIMVQLFPDQSKKYDKDIRKPFYVQQDIDYLFAVADVEKDNATLSTELKGVLGAFDDLMTLQGRLEEAISDVDVEQADKLIPQINAAIEKLNSKVDVYNNRNESIEDTNLRTAKEPSYSEKGHRLVNAGQTQEESNNFISNSAKPDFIINSTVSFEVLPEKINVVFDYNGKKIRTRLNPDSSAIGIVNKIREYQKQADGVNKQIVPIGIARTAGRIQHGTQNNNLTTVKNYWTVNDAYQINPENTIIGIGTREGIKRGNTILQKGNNYELGRSYWMVNVSRPETPNNDRKVPVHLNPVKIGDIDGLAEIILQCYEQYNQQFFTTKEGVQTPIDPTKLLDFIVYNGNDSRITEDRAKMYQPDHLANLLKKQLFLENGKLTIGTTAYDVVQLSSNPDLRKQAIDNINANFNFRINDENLYSNWGSEELKETNPFYGLKSWFDLYKKDKLTILPGVLEFDRKMVGLDSSAPKGISVLGYYIKNGLIKTDFVGMTDALIYIKDVALVEKDNGRTEKQIEESVLENPGVKVESADDLSAFFEQEFGAKFTSDQLSQQQDENELRERARTIIRKLTGLNNVETEDDVLGVTQSGLYILGKAQLDSITLSTYAPVGTEYHEAWHRISNLLMEDKQREKLFNRMRKKYGKDLSDVEIDEILAERFKEFQLGVAENIDYSVTSLFKRAWNFIKALANLKDIRLAWLYTAINRGEFAKLKPSKERIERFKNLYGEQGALYTYRGHKFNEFNNSQDIDGAIDSFIWLLFNMPGPRTDKQVQDTLKWGQTTIDPKILEETVSHTITDYSDVDKLSLDRLKIFLAKSKSPAFQELFQNFDLVQSLIKQKLKKIQVNLLERDEREEVNEEKDDDFARFDRASYEIDHYSTAPAEVKFFFNTIPEMEWRNGEIKLVKNQITGLPKFFNPRLTCNIVFNDLNNVNTIQELIDRVNEKAQTRPLYIGIKTKLDKLVERSKGNGEDAIQAEATLTKMLTTIHSNKNSFLTVRGTVETVEGKTTHSLDVIDNTAENKSRALPGQYSQALFLQGGILEINSEQGITFSQNGEKQLNSFLSFYDMLQKATQNDGKFKTKKGSYDLHDVSTQSLIKDYIVTLLNGVGITIDTGTIDEMLSRPVFGNGSEYDKLVQFLFTNTSYWGGMQLLVKRLTALRDQLKAAPKGLQTIRVDEQDIEIVSFYNSNGFVKELAKAFIQYHSNYDNLMAIGAGNNLLYSISQNNFSTDTVDELNNNSELIKQLENIPYTQASLLVQQAKAGSKFRAQTFVNFRTNNPNDVGNDYHQITDAEDYLSKMTLVLNNRLIFPTIADKKTYHVIDGVQMPNERLTSYGIVPYVGMRFGFGIQTVNQIISYANSELASIEHCINQLTPGHPEFLPEDQRIKNYHTKNKYEVGEETYSIEPNGTRFQFLNGVYVDDKFISFNNPRKTSAENLKTAKEYFFNQPVEKQIMMINELLSRRVLDEIQYAVDKGIIEYDSTNHLTNKLLDDDLINSRAEYYKKKDYKNPQHIAIIDIISQYTNNSIISINEVERVFSGNPAFYKWNYDQFGVIDASIDKIKRLGSLTSTGVNNRLDFEDFDPMYTCAELKDFEIGSRQFKDTLVPLFVDSSIREVVKQVHGIQATLREDGSNKTVEELKTEFPKEANLAEVRAKKEVAGYGKGINVADAAVYVTPEFYARMMRSIGMWSPEIAEAYRILTEPVNETERNWESQAEAYAKVMKASYKPLKYMAFGRRIENGLAVPYFNKMALFPLFESVATGDIRKLYERMTDKENPIDMVLFESAVKAGSKNPLSWKGEDGNVNDLSKFTTYKQNMRYLRQQLATDPHTHEEQMAGTQMLKVALANLDLLGNYGFGENKTKGEVIRDTIFSAMNELSNRGRKRIEEKLLDNDGRVSEEKLAKMLMEDLETQDADNNILDGVTFNPETGKMNLSLSAISNNIWLESRIISMINKEVIDVNLPGGAFIQRSAFGIAADQMDVVSDKMLNNGVALKTIDEKDGSLQAIVSINLFKHIIPNYDKMTFTEARQWLLDHNIIGENAEPSAIGYRIPTQAQASIQALKFMDVLPEIMGDTIVLPEDFTKQTGSDFDIDKLYVSRYQYDKKGNRIQFNDELGMEGNSEDAIKNKLVEQYLKVLTTLEYTNQLKVSIDNATDTVKSVLEKIESKKEVNHQTPFQVYSPHYQEEVKSEYTKGKSGIGPFALNNAHHILTQLMSVKFKSNEFTEALNLIDLDKQYDDDGSGRRILDWLSAMINAFVDIAKDPYIVRLNVNPYTFNMTAYLLRMGKGEQTFYFLKQPVIDAVAKAVLNTRGNYGKDNTKTQFEVEQEATQKVLDSFGITENVLEVQREILKDPTNLAIHLESLFSGELEKMLLSNNVSQEDKNKYQAKVWLAWQAMTPYAKDMADLVKYSKVDTKKMGKSFAAQRIFENGIDRIKDESETRFEYGVLDNFFDNTFLTTKAENSIAFGRSLFENQLLRTTPKFVLTLDNILYRLGKSKSIDERLLRTIVGSMEAAIKSEYFNQKMQDKGITPADFFYGDNTIARRLMKLRNRIYRGELNDLKNNVVGFNNALLNFLIPNTVKYETTFTEPDYVDVKTMFDQDVHSKNMIITAWEELLQHYDEEVRTLAEDLIYYSFLTSGDNKNMNSFFEFVPTSWRKEYSQFLQDKLDNNETSVNYRDIYLNNWQNNDIVPRIEQSYKEERMGTEGEMIVEEQYFEGIRGKYTLTGSSFAPYIMFTGKAGTKNRIKPIAWYKQQETNKAGLTVTRSYPVYPSFVKIRYGSTNSPTSYVVYELIGYNMEATKVGNINYVPIYVAVNKKGYRYKGHVITEYGLYQGHMFNLMSIGVTSEDFINGNIVNLINKSKNLSEEQKKQYSLTFGKNFRSISTLPSYINLAISNMYGTISEQKDTSFENQDEELPFPNQEQIGIDSNTSEYTNYSGAAPGTVTTAEEWSKKEGWSIKYYQDKVFPKINEAWQMEYEVADDQDIDPNFKGQMKYKYGNYKRSDVTADSTIEAIENGERTATTRFESDGHLDYWKKARVGDIIEFTDGATSIKVVVTKPLTKLVSSDKSVQLSLFDDMSDQDRKDIQDQIDEHNKKCNR